MRRRDSKPVVLVELSGTLVARMHQHSSYPRVMRYGHCTIYRVLQQGRAQMQSLRPAVDRKPRKHHDRNRIGHVAPHTACGQLVRNGAGCHGVVATNPDILIGDYKGAARPA